jgi:hypothetical protein
VRGAQAMAIGFIQTIREGHPSTPILVVSPIWRARPPVSLLENKLETDSFLENRRRRALQMG